LLVSVLQKNNTRNASIRLIAKTNTNITKTHILVLPKRPDPITVTLEDGLFLMQSYCNNAECSLYMQDIISEGYPISSDFMKSTAALTPGSCLHCRNQKTIRFCFEKCKFKTKLKIASSGVIVENPPETADGSRKYFYPYQNGRGHYSLLRITTKKLDEEF
jgi:hypothetical protein